MPAKPTPRSNPRVDGQSAKHSTAASSAQQRDGGSVAAVSEVVVARKPVWLTVIVGVVFGIIAILGFAVVGGTLGTVVGIVAAIACVVMFTITYMLANAETFVARLARRRAELEIQLGRRADD
jgi:hypothetical protein